MILKFSEADQEVILPALKCYLVLLKSRTFSDLDQLREMEIEIARVACLIYDLETLT